MPQMTLEKAVEIITEFIEYLDKQDTFEAFFLNDVFTALSDEYLNNDESRPQIEEKIISIAVSIEEYKKKRSKKRPSRWEDVRRFNLDLPKKNKAGPEKTPAE